MKKTAFLVLAISIVCSMFIISSCESSKSSASKLLKFNLQKGQGYDYDMITGFDQEIMGQQVKMDMNMGYALDVSADDGNIRTVNTEIKGIKMDMQMMGMKFSIDTDKPASEADTTQVPGKISYTFSKLGEAMKGKKFEMKVDKEGKIIEISGFDQLFSSLADSTHMEPDERSKALRSLKEQMNDQETKDQFTELFSIFPQKEVRVNDTWEKDYQTTGKIPAKNHTVYKVKDIDGDMVTLSAKTDIQSSDTNMKIDGTKNGTIIVDSRNGLVVNADYIYEITFNASGFSFTLKGKQKVKGTKR